MCIFRLWAEVADKYEKVLVLQPNDWRALWKWGSGLCIQAKASSVGQAFSLYKLACEKLLQAANIMPNFKTLYNAGNAHLNFAKLIGKTTVKSLSESNCQISSCEMNDFMGIDVSFDIWARITF